MKLLASIAPVLLALATGTALLQPKTAESFDFLKKIAEEADKAMRSGFQVDDGTYVHRAMQTLMPRGEAGDRAKWRNPRNGHEGVVTLVSPSSDRFGRPCWTFARTEIADGRERTFSGTACRDGGIDDNQFAADWNIVSETEDAAVPRRRAAPPASPRTPEVAARPSPPPARAAPAGRADIRQVQTVLNAMGYDAGPVDGVMGARTRNAILAFEHDNKLPMTGKPGTFLGQFRETVGKRAKTADSGAAGGKVASSAQSGLPASRRASQPKNEAHAAVVPAAAPQRHPKVQTRSQADGSDEPVRSPQVTETDELGQASTRTDKRAEPAVARPPSGTNERVSPPKQTAAEKRRARSDRTSKMRVKATDDNIHQVSAAERHRRHIEAALKKKYDGRY